MGIISVGFNTFTWAKEEVKMNNDSKKNSFFIKVHSVNPRKDNVFSHYLQAHLKLIEGARGDLGRG